LGRLSKLYHLDLDNNNLETLPDIFDELLNLIDLNLANNKLTFLPPSLRSLTKLQTLRLKGNPLPLPAESFGLPPADLLTSGVQTSQPGQALTDEATAPPETLLAFPAHFRGRNVPDVSFNADPDTGYLIVYTSDVTGFGVQTFMGGTSFVAPQLNGVTALFGQNAGQRLGLLNPLLYSLALLGGAHGPNAVLNTISAGDNWFYSGRNGYSPAAGLGTLNVAHLAKVLR
jgi:hypothetical protein